MGSLWPLGQSAELAQVDGIYHTKLKSINYDARRTSLDPFTTLAQITETLSTYQPLHPALLHIFSTCDLPQPSPFWVDTQQPSSASPMVLVSCTLSLGRIHYRHPLASYISSRRPSNRPTTTSSHIGHRSDAPSSTFTLHQQTSWPVRRIPQHTLATDIYSDLDCPEG